MTDPAQYDLSRVHLIGIGGSGMSGLARILAARGAVVTGSDVKDSTAVEVLRSMGAKVAIGHAADNLKLSGELPTTVVTSFAAIPQDNPELVAARGNNIPLIRRSDLLAIIRDSGRFGLNVLAHQQAELAMRFARKGTDKFDGVDWTADAGVPRLDGVGDRKLLVGSVGGPGAGYVSKFSNEGSLVRAGFNYKFGSY